MSYKDMGEIEMAPRVLLRSLFDTALTAVDPLLCVPGFLPPRPKGRTLVLGAGKASARMARAVDAVWDGPLTGLVVTRYGHSEPCERLDIVESGHPVPDEAGAAAAQHMLALAREMGPDDLVLALISGGGPPSSHCRQKEYQSKNCVRSMSPSCTVVPK